MNEAARALAYADIAVGDDALFTIVITQELVRDFTKLSGDLNPLHTDAGYAAGTAFKHPIAHGMLAGALFSRLIGMYLPGKYSLYLSQSLQFREPVAIGAEITVRGEVTHKTDAHRTVTIRTTAEDRASKKILVTGEAMVRLLQ